MVVVTTPWHNSVTKGAGRSGISKRPEAAESGRVLSAAVNPVALRSLQGLLQQMYLITEEHLS